MSDCTEGLTAEDVRSATFAKPPWGKRGYIENEVDELLDEVAATIANLDERLQ